jgi:hypothetical protein
VTKKADIVRVLLEDGWALPSDDELALSYLPDSGPGITGLPKKSMSGTGSSTTRLQKGKGKRGGHEMEDEDGGLDRDFVLDESLGAGLLAGLPDSGSDEVPLSLVQQPMRLESSLASGAAKLPMAQGGTVSFMQYMATMARESELRTSLLESKLVAKEDSVNFGGIPRAVQKALREGCYTSICHFWNRAVAEKRAMSLSSVAKSVSTKVRDFDWSDWVQAMLKMATAYMDAGQDGWAASYQFASWRVDHVGVLLKAVRYGGL